MRTKWIYTMFVLVLSLFTSCNNEADEAAGNKKTRTIVFRLSVDDAVGSRATWGDSYSPGEADVPFDTRINLDGLQVVVYDANNNYVGEAKNVLYWSVSGNENKNPEVDNVGNVTANEEYRFVGDLSHLNLAENANYKLMLFANCPEVEASDENGKDDEDKVNELSFALHSLDYPDGAIPMWGMKPMTITRNTDLIDLGVIDLLRAVAKVEVVLADNLKSTYSLKSVTANIHNEYGYCAPAGWTETGITETKNLDQDGCFHPYRSVREQILESGGNENKQFIYLTEFDHTAFNNLHDTQLSVTLTHNVDDGHSHERTFESAISFSNFDIGHIVRNHIYRFTITEVQGGVLNLAYKVADWDRIEFKNDFEGDNDPVWNLQFEYPTYLNPLRPNKVVNGNNIPDNGDDNNHPNYTAPVMTYTSSIKYDPFICWLNITGPSSGLTWNPYMDSSDFAFADIEVYKYKTLTGESELVYKTNSSEPELKNPLLVYADGWYMIKIIPTSEKSNEVLKLRLTYHQEWMGSDASRSLLINGTEAGNTVWPNSGNDPYVIEITLNKTNTTGGS